MTFRLGIQLLPPPTCEKCGNPELHCKIPPLCLDCYHTIIKTYHIDQCKICHKKVKDL